MNNTLTVRKALNVSSAPHFTYLNSKNTYAPLGIGFGGQGGNMARLHVSSNFKGHFPFTDRMYEQGHVLDAALLADDDDEDVDPATPPFQWEFSCVSLEV